MYQWNDVSGMSSVGFETMKMTHAVPRYSAVVGVGVGCDESAVDLFDLGSVSLVGTQGAEQCHRSHVMVG